MPRISLLTIDRLLIATLVTTTWTKLYWASLGRVPIATLLGVAFAACYIVHRFQRRDAELPRGVAGGIGWLAALGVVYLAGFAGLTSIEGQNLFIRGFADWGMHALFLVAAALRIADGGEALLRRCIAAFVVGAAINAAYGVLQLVAWGAGSHNLDLVVLSPLGFGDATRGIQFFGAGIYRINGFMRDTNHFGVMLGSAIPLALVAFRGSKRWWLTALLTGAMALSLSRSGGVGLIAALIVLAIPARQRLVRSRQLLIAVGVVALALIAFTQVFPNLTDAIISSRLDPDTRSAQTHLGIYELVPQMLRGHELLGVGYNTFSLSFEQISGRAEFGPHSLYVRLAVETGLVGIAVFLGFAVQLLRSLWAARWRTNDDRMLRAGVAAAIVGAWAGNAFYLTTQIVYVDALYALGLALPYALGNPAWRTVSAEDELQSSAYGRAHGSTSPA
jgi:O-antigen ligase